jgi:hypothetical protein
MSPLDVFPGYRAVVVLNLPGRIDIFIIYAGGKFNTMSSNARYSSLSTELGTLNTHTIALSKSQTGFKSKPPSVSKAQRDSDKATVVTDIRLIAGKVQEMADEDPENAETIISEAGFGVKKIPIRQKQKCTVTDGPEKGSVVITGEGRGAHNFRISTDGVTWTNLLASSNSRKIEKNLTVGKLYYFQSAKALKNGEEGQWSQSVSIVVR